MKLVMTLLVRDEADIVDAQIAFHLSRRRLRHRDRQRLGRRYAGDPRALRARGVLRLLRESGDDMRQEEWVTRMARLAATDFGADWVINTDADEFWWPRGGTLKDVLALVPGASGSSAGCWRHFVRVRTATRTSPSA